MLNYLQESKATSVVDEATREIDGYVRGVKENPKAEEAYMTIGDIIDREVEEAVEKAVENTTRSQRYGAHLVRDPDSRPRQQRDPKRYLQPAEAGRLLAKIGTVTHELFWNRQVL